MNRLVLFDAKQSREVLKAIRYGMELKVASVSTGEEADWLSLRLKSLRKRYLARRPHIDEKRSTFGNVIFYQLLKEKYHEFQYRVDKRGSPLSNLYDFKIDGRLPSLLTMLINDNVRYVSEPEKRYGPSECFQAQFPHVERFFEEALLVWPDPTSFQRFLDAVLHAQRSGQTLQIVVAICPDYSYTSEDSNVRYTFESVGVRPGLAGMKFLAILPAVQRFFDALGVAYAVNLYGGDFESLAYDDAYSPLGVTRAQFVERVRQQIANIADMLVGVPACRGFFFDEVGGEGVWVARHEQLYEALTAGDLGSTGLDANALDAVFAARLPLYKEWFKGVDERALRHIFLKQATDYALMGEIYSRRFKNFVVLGVDHHRMAPFYSFVRPVTVIYRQTDYIVEDTPTSVSDNSVGEAAHAVRDLEEGCVQ